VPVNDEDEADWLSSSLASEAPAAAQRDVTAAAPVAASIVTSSGDAEQVSLDEIATGTAFVRTTQPWPSGATLRLRIIVDGAPLIIGARVESVVSAGMSVAVGHAPGMAVRFDALPAEVEAKLRRVVERSARSDKAPAPQAVELPVEAPPPPTAQEEDDIPLVVGLKTDSDRTIEVKIQSLVGEADAAEAANDRRTARSFLEQALVLKPRDASLKERLSGLEVERAGTRAASLLDDALKSNGARAVELVREAVRASQDRKILARAVETFTALGAYGESLLAGEYLVALYPDDVPTLNFLLETHVSAGRFEKAAPYGQALLRLAPDDVRLQERIGKIMKAAVKR
jgi:tetratricopeptide (TPR) repeat protein